MKFHVSCAKKFLSFILLKGIFFAHPLSFFYAHPRYNHSLLPVQVQQVTKHHADDKRTCTSQSIHVVLLHILQYLRSTTVNKQTKDIVQ